MALVGASIGVAVIPEMTPLPFGDLVSSRPLSTKLTSGLGVAWKHGFNSPLRDSILELAVAVAAKS